MTQVLRVLFKSRLLRAAFSLSVQAGVVLSDAGASGVLLLGDVGSDQAVGIEPHVADRMSAKQAELGVSTALPKSECWDGNGLGLNTE